MLGDLAQEIFKIVLELLGYLTGKYLVLFSSRGRLHVSTTVESELAVKQQLKSWRSTFSYGGQRYIRSDLVTLIGILFWAIVIVIGVWIG